MKTLFRSVAGWLLLGAAHGLAGADSVSPPDNDAYVPCRIHQRAPIDFPSRLRAEGVLRGSAVVMVEIDTEGRLADLLVVAYTHREFGEAVRESALRWEFTPGYLGEQPLRSIMSLVVEFRTEGVVAQQRAPSYGQVVDPLGQRYAFEPASIRELDRVPAAVVTVNPFFAPEWAEAGHTGEVTVEFFIDEEGRVRMPRFTGEAKELLGMAAVAAMREWRFEPARRRGRPVLVRAQQVFRFGRSPAPDAR
jgi:TonB family protein